MTTLKKHYYRGKAFWRVKGLSEGECTGCHFHTNKITYGDTCPNGERQFRNYHASCWDYEELEDGTEVTTRDDIWIPATKKAMAAYVALKLGAPDENEDTS
jgi:hypothetical protein